MERFGFLHNGMTCIGCHSCQFACAEEHTLPAGFWLRRAAQVKSGGLALFFSGACNHCENPACLQACQTGAMFAGQGLVLHDETRCIGCGACMWSCPYGAVSIHPATGKARKCDGCATRRGAGLVPACVAACPTQSLLFGPVEELERLGGKAPSTAFLPPPQLTEPSLRLIFREEGGAAR